MKYCNKCGAQLADTAKFCAKCGTKVPEAASESIQTSVSPVKKPKPEKKQKREKKPVKKGKVIAILCLIVVVLIAAVGGYFGLKWYFSPEQQLLRALNKGDFDTALEIVDEDASLRKNEELAAKLQERIAAVKSDFTAGTAEYAVALNELETIEVMKIKGLDDAIEETRAFVEKLNASRTAFATAESFFNSGDYVEAIAQYKQVIQEDGNYEIAKTKSAEAVNLYRTKVLEDAVAYGDVGNYDNALTLLNDALKNLPEDSLITQQIQLYDKAKADQILATALEQAAQYAAAEDYTSAITVLEQYISQHGENVDVGVALNTYKGSLSAKLLAAALETAEAYAQTGDYLSAMKTLNTYTSDYGTEASVVVALSGYTESYVDAVLAEAETSANGGDYVTAIKAIRAAQSNVSADRLTTRLNTYTADYEAEIIAESDALLADEDYDGAQAVVDQGLQTLPNSTALKNQSGKIEGARPKNFMEVCSPYQNEDAVFYTGEKNFSMGGMEYSNGFTVKVYEGGGWILSNLGGEYSKLSFIAGHVDGSGMGNVKLTIYLDGEVFDSYNVVATELPKKITIDVGGVMQIKIVASFYDWDGYPTVGVGNMEIR